MPGGHGEDLVGTSQPQQQGIVLGEVDPPRGSHGSGTRNLSQDTAVAGGRQTRRQTRSQRAKVVMLVPVKSRKGVVVPV